MLRVAAESPPQPGATPKEGPEAEDRRPLWWYARVVRRHRPAGGRFLEDGCGEGRLLGYLADDFEVFGYDDDPVRRHRCRAAVPDAVVLEAWEEAEAGGYDVVACLRGPRGPRAAQVVRRLSDKVAPGGLLFVVAPNPGGFAHRMKGRDWFADELRTGSGLLSRGEWMTLMRRAGLKVVDIESDGLWDAPYLPLIPAFVQRAVCDMPEAVQSVWPMSRSLWPAAVGENLLITARKDS
jgi:SAM-dependent methyltransferase